MSPRAETKRRIVTNFSDYWTRLIRGPGKFFNAFHADRFEKQYGPEATAAFQDYYHLLALSKLTGEEQRRFEKAIALLTRVTGIHPRAIVNSQRRAKKQPF